MRKVKEKVCANPECENKFTPRYKTTEKYCSYACANACAKPKKPTNPLKRTPIKKDPNYRMPKKSKRRQREERIYRAKRIVFLQENPICFIDGCGKPATTIEHRAGRIGSNYLDVSTWAPCCLECNLELERNPEMSKKYQLSKIHGGKKT